MEKKMSCGGFKTNSSLVEEEGVLKVNSPFIVTLHPAEGSYSGAMDKTVSEIYEAYQDGRKIMFYFEVEGAGSMEIDVTSRGNGSPAGTYPSFNGLCFTNNEEIMLIYTGFTNDGTSNSYDAVVYSLTPAEPI